MFQARFEAFAESFASSCEATDKPMQSFQVIAGAHGRNTFLFFSGVQIFEELELRGRGGSPVPRFRQHVGSRDCEKHHHHDPRDLANRVPHVSVFGHVNCLVADYAKPIVS